jgi:hypothetical protein
VNVGERGLSMIVAATKRCGQNGSNDNNGSSNVSSGCTDALSDVCFNSSNIRNTTDGSGGVSALLWATPSLGAEMISSLPSLTSVVLTTALVWTAFVVGTVGRPP